MIKDLNGEVKMIADRIEDLYYLRETGEQVKAATTEGTRIKDADLRHAKLGHLHMDAVVNLSKGQAIRIKTLEKNTCSCDVCHRGKLMAVYR
ncbi:unnamed protein product [Hermetia illucens]|uniref:GAG-pre-integrase domain-containing protein n=1 Tax=Hermetia illucens TaxID=343691 RepID=A0A7R8UHH5_HERIL|nr:unnamed protein product [Hermetia illucens]